ncbi:MAG: BrnT family toxin [Candidatus Dadabacteria bacterium]|nr:BrnT family toxin [Candidatus Dadabacteria bacterium]
MEYQWDPEKEKLNYKKHNVRFSETVIVLEDPFAITIEDNSSKNEQRFITIGMDAYANILVVVYTYREEDIRIISARKATKNEIKQYGDK